MNDRGRVPMNLGTPDSVILWLRQRLPTLTTKDWEVIKWAAEWMENEEERDDWQSILSVLAGRYHE